MKVFETIYESWNDCSEQSLIDRCNGLDWSEIPVTEQEPLKHSRYVLSSNGIGVYYCYGADHYWFTDETGD